MAITLLRKLQDDHPDDYPDDVLRTLQRDVRQWRALEGPGKEVSFPQDHAPGHRGLSDFTTMAELRITIAGEPFVHIPYHFVLAFSRWEHVEVVEGGESFAALSKGLKYALWRAGGVPQEHRTDSLSAAVKNLAAEEDFAVRYTVLLDHYDMADTLEIEHQVHEILADALEHRLFMRRPRQGDLGWRAARQRRQQHTPQCGAQGCAEPSLQRLELEPGSMSLQFLDLEGPGHRQSQAPVRFTDDHVDLHRLTEQMTIAPPAAGCSTERSGAIDGSDDLSPLAWRQWPALPAANETA